MDVVRMAEEQKKKGGLQPSLLKEGTKIKVQTNNSFYEFKMTGPDTAMVSGGLKSDGSVRFTQPTEVEIHGSTWGGKALKTDWIGQNMHLEFGLVSHHAYLTTSVIKNVVVEDPDGKWSYSMDWDKDST